MELWMYACTREVAKHERCVKADLHGSIFVLCKSDRPTTFAGHIVDFASENCARVPMVESHDIC